MSTTPRAPLMPRWWQRLWVKLAVFGVLGVIATHAIQLKVATRSARRALAARLVKEGQVMAAFVAHRGADAILSNDTIAMQELVEGVARSAEVAYCFVHQGERVLASSFGDQTPTSLVTLPRRGLPVIVRSEQRRYLDLGMPVLGGRAGQVRVGMEMSVLDPPLQQQALDFGLIALGVMLAGLLAAFLVGRRLALPLGDMVTALESMDPTKEPRPLPERSGDEIGVLTQKVNEMRSRLHVAHRERERAQRKQMQTEKLAALGTLVTGVAHEVNNPLAGLKNCVWRLQKDDTSDARRREYTEMMSDGLARIEKVVQQLLDFARMRPPRRSAEPLARLLKTVRDLAQPALRSRRVELVLDLEGATELLLHVDAHQLEQALLNLLLNAIYFSPEGERVRVGARREGSAAIVEIEDRGPGISAEDMAQIEDPFFTTKPEGEGTGLGLSVTRTIVESHRGEMSFVCPPEGGTTVILRLPLAQPHEAKEGAA